MTHCYRTYLLIALLLAITGKLTAQDSPGIRDVQPFVQNDSLGCGIACPGLFSGKVEQTLLSGLPVLLEVRFRITAENGSVAESPAPLKYRASYDIWEDRFLVEGAAKQHFFPTLKALQDWWDPRETVFFPIGKSGNSQNELKIESTIRVILLSRSQSQKMKDWILQTDETEEDIPSMNRDTGFTLNLNQVVSLFLNKSDSGESFELRGGSGTFTIGDLPRREKVGSRQ